MFKIFIALLFVMLSKSNKVQIDSKNVDIDKITTNRECTKVEFIKLYNQFKNDRQNEKIFDQLLNLSKEFINNIKNKLVDEKYEFYQLSVYNNDFVFFEMIGFLTDEYMVHELENERISTFTYIEDQILEKRDSDYDINRMKLKKLRTLIYFVFFTNSFNFLTNDIQNLMFHFEDFYNSKIEDKIGYDFKSFNNQIKLIFLIEFKSYFRKDQSFNKIQELNKIKQGIDKRGLHDLVRKLKKNVKKYIKSNKSNKYYFEKMIKYSYLILFFKKYLNIGVIEGKYFELDFFKLLIDNNEKENEKENSYFNTFMETSKKNSEEYLKNYFVNEKRIKNFDYKEDLLLNIMHHGYFGSIKKLFLETESEIIDKESKQKSDVVLINTITHKVIKIFIEINHLFEEIKNKDSQEHINPLVKNKIYYLEDSFGKLGFFQKDSSLKDRFYLFIKNYFSFINEENVSIIKKHHKLIFEDNKNLIHYFENIEHYKINLLFLDENQSFFKIYEKESDYKKNIETFSNEYKNLKYYYKYIFENENSIYDQKIKSNYIYLLFLNNLFKEKFIQNSGLNSPIYNYNIFAKLENNLKDKKIAITNEYLLKNKNLNDHLQNYFKDTEDELKTDLVEFIKFNNIFYKNILNECLFKNYKNFLFLTNKEAEKYNKKEEDKDLTEDDKNKLRERRRDRRRKLDEIKTLEEFQDSLKPNDNITLGGEKINYFSSTILNEKFEKNLLICINDFIVENKKEIGYEKEDDISYMEEDLEKLESSDSKEDFKKETMKKIETNEKESKSRLVNYLINFKKLMTNNLRNSIIYIIEKLDKDNEDKRQIEHLYKIFFKYVSTNKNNDNDKLDSMTVDYKINN